MALQKQAIPINFAKGVDTKTDPRQVQVGKFLKRKNSVFTTGGLMQKANGFKTLTSLTNLLSTYLTTFNNNLIAIGSQLNAYLSGPQTWVDKGSIQTARLSTLPTVRLSTNVPYADSAVASNGLVCTVFGDDGDGSGIIYKYTIQDSITGQSVVNTTAIPPLVGVISGSPKVYVLSRYFVIVAPTLSGGTDRLQYTAIPISSPTQIAANANLSTQVDYDSTSNFDGVVANDTLYVAWNGSDVSGAIRTTYLTSSLTQANTVVEAGKVATHMSVTADTSGPSATVWVTYYDAMSQDGYTQAYNPILVQTLAPTQIISGLDILNITSSAQNSLLTAIYEVNNTYTYGAIPTHSLEYLTVTLTGTVSSSSPLVRSVGLASESFILGGKIYVLAVFQSDYQPSYFLLDMSGNVIVKLAASNAGGYYITGLPSANVAGKDVQIAYLYKDLIQATNKSQDAPSSAAIYSQTGSNLVTISIGASNLSSAEIGKNLHITGGFLWQYDGTKPVENGFFYFPEVLGYTSATTGGLMTKQQYFYQAVYEWMDNQGNINRSAPSLPLSVNLTGSATATNKVTVKVPTLRLTYKTLSPVKIVIYRWSTAQQNYYQVTSITSPLLNDTTVDEVSFVDTQSDAQIIGNSLIYTTGGVIENISPPSFDAITLWQSRLFGIDAEDKDLLWYSKQVIESTPVEMSDLLTLYVAPTTGAPGSTGPSKCLFVMDDKLIVFKDNAIYYVAGSGPDNTGANNQYTEPVFITSTVGSNNQQSLVFMPNGIMFQSDKGIWLLGRDLSTQYIGAPVEAYNNLRVVSAINIPETNQVRFVLDNNTMLVYDYFYGEWDTRDNIQAISSTVYSNLQTYISSDAQVLMEDPTSSLIGNTPVLMSFTTGWINVAGMQGFERAYFFQLLATYLSPHKLRISVAYDYNPSPQQVTVITPDNYNPPYGDGFYGDESPYSGNDNVEQWRIFFKQQKCQAFQITVEEIYDPSFNVPAGKGLQISGLNLVVGLKKGYTTLRASRSAG